jgi:hypothetical protein
MSDASEAPTRADTTEVTDPDQPTTGEPQAPHGTETALGGMTRDTLRAASPVTTQIREALTFHDSGTASQAVRDVLGAIERAADEASRRRPRNRPPEFAELSPPALRQLAALCRVYRVESVDSTPAVPERIDSAAAIAEIERGIMSDRDAATLLTEVLGAEPIETMTIGSGDGIDVVTVNLDNTHATFTPDPFVGPAPLTPMEQIGEVLAAGVASFTSDPFATPAPLPAEEDEPIRIDGSDQPPF